MITNSEEVTNYFGYWPEFCDAHVETFSYKVHDGVIELSVFYVDVDLKKSARIGLRFVGVTEMQINELRSENVIDEIRIEAGTPSIIRINSAFGLCGQFCCANSAVTYVHV